MTKSKSKTAELLEELDKKIDNVKDSDEFQDMLDFFSKFHNYSYHNTLLIQMQYPQATYVAGYNQWKDKFNRHVKKGEDGIAILAPFTYTETETQIKEVVTTDGDIEEKEVEKEIKKTYFRPVYVFDISQTEGEKVPELDMSLNDNFSSLLLMLEKFANKNDINITYKPLSDRLEGYSKKDEIVLNSNANDTEKASTLAHEIAHILLHNREDSRVEENSDSKLTKEIKEMEAEAVAYIIFKHFDKEIKSDKYLALYKESYDLQDSLERIKKVSKIIIDFLLEEMDI